MKKLTPILLLAVFALQGAPTAQALPPAAQWIPRDAVISLEVSQPKELLKLLSGNSATTAVVSSPIYQSLISQPQYKELLDIVAYLEATWETDWRTGLGKLAGGGITVAVCPQDIVILIADAEDRQMLERTHEVFLEFARSEAEKQGKSTLVASTQYKDVTAWTFNGKESHAIIGSRLILANRPEGLRAVLELRDKAASETMAANPDYRAAKEAAGADAVATAFANLRILKHVPGIDKLFTEQPKDALATLMFAGILDALRDSNRLTLGLSIEEKTLVVRASVDGKAIDPASPAAFAFPKEPGEGALPNLDVPRRVAAMSLHRDLYQFYAAKDDLFGERTSGLIFFENMMGIFFSGRDLTTEVLSQTTPEIRLVVAQQEYDPAIGTPQVELPAFAAIFKLRDPEHFDIVVEEAWQKAIGLVNFTRGQQAMPGLIIDRPVHSETTFTVAYFSAAEMQDKTKLDQRFNFRPSLVTLGNYLILSSTDGLAQDLIDALNREMKSQVKPLAKTHSVVEIDIKQLASILQANRLTLVRNDMIKKGTTQEESESGIDLLIGLIRCIDSAKLSIGTHGGLTEARLEILPNIQ